MFTLALSERIDLILQLLFTLLRVLKLLLQFPFTSCRRTTRGDLLAVRPGKVHDVDGWCSI